jgi:hypothetical protein
VRKSLKIKYRYEKDFTYHDVGAAGHVPDVGAGI